jgi:CheY-like chemotaxis protein
MLATALLLRAAARLVAATTHLLANLRRLQGPPHGDGTTVCGDAASLQAQLQADLPEWTAAPAAPRRTILVAEDDFFLRSAIVDVLRRNGFTVFDVRDTSRAWEVLQSNEVIDLLFTDIRLPGFIDGLDLARLVRSRHPQLKIIVASGDTLTENDREAVDGYLGKPYQFDHMVAMIRRLLGYEVSGNQCQSPAGEPAHAAMRSA